MIETPRNKLILAVLTAFCATSLFTYSTANANQDPFSNNASSNDLILAGHHGGGKGHKMKKMDLNGDGSISKDEFMNNSEKKFNKKDENGDGVLTEDEMKRQCKHRKGKKVLKEE